MTLHISHYSHKKTIILLKNTNITKKSAGDAINTVIEGITAASEKRNSISLIGLGSFKVVKRVAREGRNLSTVEKYRSRPPRVLSSPLAHILKTG
jgi:DNA-binding protein HU-beta